METNVKPEYEGRYFIKELSSGTKIRIDKVEKTWKYKRIIYRVEIKALRELYHNPKIRSLGGWDEEWQLPGYACACDYCYLYYDIKKRILREEYGIDYLTFADLNR